MNTAQPPGPGSGPDASREPHGGTSGLKSQAREAAGEAKHEASAMAEDLKAQGQDLADAARERARSFSEEQKELGAARISGVASAVNKAADELEQSSPGLARYTREAASAVDSMSDALRNRSVGDLMHSANDFARREPVAFFGAAMVAGFALSRFLKSSREPVSSGPGHPSSGYGARGAAADHSPSQATSGSSGTASPAPLSRGSASANAGALGTAPVAPESLPPIGRV